MIITPDWLVYTPARAILQLLALEGHSAFYVGGCVRDSLMGIEPKDIDIATSATPDQVTQLCSARGMGVHPTGIAHGTVTVNHGGGSFEVTTFRKDVTTDGRNATVSFTTDVNADAQRRDFTVNALYMDKSGIVYDSTGNGVEDVMHRRIRFVGDARARCKEDYLRILRYFRFYARFGGGPVDQDALNAVIENWHELFVHVSGERMWDETKKILSLPDPVPALVLMERLGILRHLLHKDHNDPWWLYALIRAEQSISAPVDWHRRYVALAGAVKPQWPISRAEENRLRQTAQNAHVGHAPALLAFQYREVEIARDCHLLNRAESFMPAMSVDALDAEIGRGLAAELPVQGASFFPHGIGPGPALGSVLHFAKEGFKASNLSASAEELITYALKKASEHKIAS